MALATSERELTRAGYNTGLSGLCIFTVEPFVSAFLRSLVTLMRSSGLSSFHLKSIAAVLAVLLSSCSADWRVVAYSA